MDPVYFGEAIAPQTPSPEISPQTPSSPPPPAGPEQPVEGQPPPQEQKHFNWPWHRWVLVSLAVIVFLSLVAYITYRPQLITQIATPVSTPTPSPSKASATEGDPTANWKTYTNKTVPGCSAAAFSIKYPKSWQVEDGIDVLTLSKNGYSISVARCGVDGGSCIWGEGTTDEGIVEFENAPYVQINSGIGALRRIIQPEDYEPGQIEYNFCGIDGSDFVTVTKIGRIDYIVPVNPKKEMLDEMDKIVSTIQAAPDETANWKEYKNNQFKYSLRYPQNWYVNFDSAEYREIASVPTNQYLRGIGGPPKGGAWVAIERVGVRGKDSVETSESGQDVPLVTITEFSENKDIIIVIRGRYWADPASEADNRLLIEQILSTFQFTN